MRIVVAVKYVPDIHADRGFEGGRVVRRSDEGTLNELDENAVEAALRVKEALPEDERATSEVVVVTVAGPDADSAVRKTFQLGADRGVRVSDEAIAGSDYFGTARVLAAAVRRLEHESPVDLVVTGMAALDGLGSVVPTLLSAELGLPQLTLAGALEVSGEPGARSARVTRELDGVDEVLEAPLPAVVSVTDHANDPRMPNFKLIMAARTRPVEAWSLADLDVDPADVGDAGARTRVVDASPRPPRPEVEIVVDKGEGGRALAEYLIRTELV
ncbi:electron transfer flavoprotein subunit beta/FixA family protein [Cellulosimicrobium terreum]|nr:electron transfer flavoprotein subunit beta/FixA family protein [Cellulosimicrobium terreum]